MKIFYFLFIVISSPVLAAVPAKMCLSFYSSSISAARAWDLATFEDLLNFYFELLSMPESSDKASMAREFKIKYREMETHFGDAFKTDFRNAVENQTENRNELETNKKKQIAKDKKAAEDFTRFSQFKSLTATDAPSHVIFYDDHTVIIPQKGGIIFWDLVKDAPIKKYGNSEVSASSPLLLSPDKKSLFIGGSRVIKLEVDLGNTASVAISQLNAIFDEQTSSVLNCFLRNSGCRQTVNTLFLALVVVI